MKKIVFVSLLLGSVFSSIHAQELINAQEDNVSVLLGFNPELILNDWKNWDLEKTPQNKFIEDFMKTNNVPTAGLWNLTKYDTWMWWIQTNPDQSKLYLELRKKHEIE